MQMVTGTAVWRLLDLHLELLLLLNLKLMGLLDLLQDLLLVLDLDLKLLGLKLLVNLKLLGLKLLVEGNGGPPFQSLMHHRPRRTCVVQGLRAPGSHLK